MCCDVLPRFSCLVLPMENSKEVCIEQYHMTAQHSTAQHSTAQHSTTLTCIVSLHAALKTARQRRVYNLRHIRQAIADAVIWQCSLLIESVQQTAEYEPGSVLNCV